MKRKLLAVALCSCLLVGCSNGSQTTTTSQNDSVSSTTNITTEDTVVTSIAQEKTETSYTTVESSVPTDISENYDMFDGEVTKWLITTDNDYPNYVWLSTPIIMDGDKFDEKTESEIMARAYVVLKDLFDNYTTDAISVNAVFLDLSNGGNEIIGSAIITNLAGFNVSPIEWKGKYEKWNDMEVNQSCADLINLRIKNPIEINGYRATFLGTYSFRKIDNQFSDMNGSIVVAIDVKIENLSSDSDYFPFFNTITTPNNKESVIDYSTFFDDLEIDRKCPKGSCFTGAFCVPYDGLGDYTISFGYFPIAGSYRIEITDTPEERGITPNQERSYENTSESQSISIEEIKEQYNYEYVSNNNYGKYVIEATGHTGYCVNSSNSQFVFYIDDFDGLNDYEIINNAYIDLFSSAALYPGKFLYSFYIAEQDGNLVAMSGYTPGDNGYIGMPITWVGDYERLNENEISQKWYNDYFDTSD